MATKTVLPGNEARGIAAKSGRGVARPRAWLGPSKMTDATEDDSSTDTECPACGRDDFASRRAMKIHCSKSHGGGDNDTECPTCGRSDFASRAGMKNHHKWAHGESIAGVGVKCAWCGDEKRVGPHRAEECENHFCTNKPCESKWNSEHLRGENHPAWGGGPAEVECSWCGATLERPPNEVERCGTHFCSEKNCRSRYQSKNWVGEDASHWCGGTITVNCAWCGEKKEVEPHRYERNENHFCGDGADCRRKWWSENITGEAHHLWEGGPFPYGAGFTYAKKEKVRERQGRRCAGCGALESEQPTRLPVHHIQKARLVDDDEARNDDSVLVALCRSCHSQWEKMTPLRPQTPHLD